VSVPQQITCVTLGARSMTTLRAFYSGLGWTEREGSDDAFTAYDAGTVRLALFPLEQLGLEAAPGEPIPAGWNGVTLAINVHTADSVDEVFRRAVDAGAKVIAEPVRRDWGGYSGYLSDPEGNRWEIAWAPGFIPEV